MNYINQANLGKLIFVHSLMQISIFYKINKKFPNTHEFFTDEMFFFF